MNYLKSRKTLTMEYSKFTTKRYQKKVAKVRVEICHELYTLIPYFLKQNPDIAEGKNQCHLKDLGLRRYFRNFKILCTKMW